MTYDENNNKERQMYQGNWACSKCGTAITELPFEPDPDRIGSLQCRDCHRAIRDRNQGGQQRQMYQGNWACSKCGTAITELPFEPDPDRSGALQCRDCYRAR